MMAYRLILQPRLLLFMPELRRARTDEIAPFVQHHERSALSSFYGFPTIWHQEAYDVAAFEGSKIVGVARVGVAASLAQIERIIVAPDVRRQGIGRELIEMLADIANYYNCHKLCAQAVADSPAETFYAACGISREAVLAQHTFKCDIALLRRYLL